MATTTIAAPRLDLLRGDNDPCVLVLQKGMGERYATRILITTTRLEEVFSAGYNDEYQPTNAQEIKFHLDILLSKYPTITYCKGDAVAVYGIRRGPLKGSDVSTQQFWSSEISKRKAKCSMPGDVEEAMRYLESLFHIGQHKAARDLWEDARKVLFLYKAARDKMESKGSTVREEIRRLDDEEKLRRYEQSQRDRKAHEAKVRAADERQAEVWRVERERAARAAKQAEAQKTVEAAKALEAERTVQAIKTAEDLALGMEKYATMVRAESKTAVETKVPEVERQASKAVVTETKPVAKTGDAFASCLAAFTKKTAVKA